MLSFSSKWTVMVAVLTLSFSSSPPPAVNAYNTPPPQEHTVVCSRRNFLSKAVFASGAFASLPFPSRAAFTPGGTLVDRDVGVTVGNAEASASRAVDNTNVLFGQDYYFKFGTAAQWIEPGNTEYPKTMPFTLSQQRYDALKKYGDRVKKGMAAIEGLGAAIDSGDFATIADASASQYAMRPMGLMANSFMASENTGATNELFLARWYINEMYLAVEDIRNAPSKDQAKLAYSSAKKAANSYLGMLNRVITPKVGDKFDYLN